MQAKGQFFLQDLPALALEEITKHLWPRDLACARQTCSTWNNMLHPRLTSLMRARHLGKKWVLRATGHALFMQLCQNWEAGEIKWDQFGFEYEPLPEHLRSLQAAQSQKAVSNWQAIEIGFRRLKSAYVLDAGGNASVSQGWWISPRLSRELFPLEVPDWGFTYLCNLANAMGFAKSFSLLETVVFDRSLEIFQRFGLSSDLEILADLRSIGRAPRIHDPDFFHDFCFDHNHFCGRGLVVPSTFWLLPAELQAPLFLLAFLVKMDSGDVALQGGLEGLSSDLENLLSLGQ